MRTFLRNSEKRAELSALMMVIAVLAIGAVAKLDAVTLILEFVR
jgi:hypothetical protein